MKQSFKLYYFITTSFISHNLDIKCFKIYLICIYSSCFWVLKVTKYNY